MEKTPLQGKCKCWGLAEWLKDNGAPLKADKLQATPINPRMGGESWLPEAITWPPCMQGGMCECMEEHAWNSWDLSPRIDASVATLKPTWFSR